MKDLKIGKLLITKEGLLTITFAGFLGGVLIGAFIATKSANSNGNSNFIFIFFGVLIWSILIPTLRKQIKIIN